MFSFAVDTLERSFSKMVLSRRNTPVRPKHSQEVEFWSLVSLDQTQSFESHSWDVADQRTQVEDGAGTVEVPMAGSSENTGLREGGALGLWGESLMAGGDL